MEFRFLTRFEIPLVWSIDRSETNERIYYLNDGQLVLEDEPYDMQGWPPGEAEHYTPHLLDCFERGGTFWGAFESEKLVGVAVLESKFVGSRKDTLQLKFLHVSRDQRGAGLGKRLFHIAAEKARSLGAKKMYISSTPSEHTVDFYMRQGCRLAEEIDPELFALEPEDIHLEFKFEK